MYVFYKTKPRLVKLKIEMIKTNNDEDLAHTFQ